MRLSEASFVVTDTETTGMRAGEDRVIEVAAVRVRGGQVVDRFQQLINPGRDVPGRIARLTGITTAHVVDQPYAEAVLPRYLAFLDGGIFVAHNLNFDLRFLNAELRCAGMSELPPATLCTLRLARRLLPGLRSKSLASVCEFYQVRNGRAHRALGDAEATAEILLRFLHILERDHGINTIEDLLAFQHRRYRSAARSRHLTAIRTQVLPNVPELPGVYFMRDGTQKVIYIGKARSLRARVTSYFTAIEGHPPRLRKMMDVVRGVTWQATDSELEAMILESRLIKEMQPRFNRAQREYRVRPFLRISSEEDFPKLSVVPVLKRDGASYFGPFDERAAAERVAELVDRFFLLRTCTDREFGAGVPCEQARLGRCGAPCAGFVTREAYHIELERVESFLDGSDTSVVHTIEEAMRRAAVAMRYEEAASLRDGLQFVRRLLERDGCIAPSVLDQNAVLAHVDREVDQSTTFRLHLVRHGRLLESLRLPIRLTERDCAEIRRCVHACFAEAAEGPERYYVQEVDEVRVLRQWMYTHRDRVLRVAWDHDEPADSFSRRVLAELGRVSESQAASKEQGASLG